MLSVILHHRRAATWASAAAGLALLGVAAASIAGAPATPEPSLVALQRSPSGKIIDRMPGPTPAGPRLAVSFLHSDWAMSAALEPGFAVASAATGDLDDRSDAAVETPIRVAAAKAPVPPSKPARQPAKPHTTPATVAALPPPRPISLRTPQPAIEIAASKERRRSYASRMIAFVGSLAALASPL